MTVPATTRRAGPFNGNGVTTSFPFTFKVFTTADLAVSKTSATGITTALVLGSDYSVTLNPDQDAAPGGSITYPLSGSPLATGESLVAVGALPYDQTTSFPAGGSYRASTHENAFDRTVFQIQQLAEENARTIKLPPEFGDVDAMLPVPEAGQVIAWGDDGQSLVNLSPADIASVVVSGTSYTNTFSGTGVATQFTLTANPGGANAVDVSIGGVVQTAGLDFTVSGTTITFTEAPPSGTNNVTVRYTAALPVGTANAQDVSFLQAGTGAVSRNVQSRLRDMVSVKDFGAKGDTVTNDTAAIQAAINAVAAAGGGVVYFPPGIYMVQSLSITLAVSAAITLRGAGKYATYLRKISGSAPVLAMASTSTLTMDVVGGVEDLTLDGVDKAGNGLQLTNLARFHLTRVAAIRSAVGIESLGSLCFMATDPLLNGNGIGYRCRQAGAVRANLVEFHGGEARSNSSFAFDLGDCDSVVVRGTDISGNGTAANINTGGVIIRDTIDDETGFARIVFDGAWFEANFGTAFRTESVTNGHLVLDSCNFYTTEKIGGVRQDINALGLRSIVLRSVLAPTADAGVVTIACNNSIVEGGQFQTLTDTSTHRRHNTRTSGGVLVNRMTQLNITGASGQELLICDDSVAAAGSANDATVFKQGAGVLRFRFAGGSIPLLIGPAALGFYSTNPIAKPTVTGAKGGNAALTSLLTQLNALGLITDSTT